MLPLLAASLAACRSAQPPRAPAPDAGAGRAAYQLLFEQALTRRDTAALEAAVAPELTFHAGAQTARVPRAQMFALAAPILTAFPDVQFRVEHVVAEGDVAAARLRFTGTHRGAWRGIAPTGRPVAVTEMFFCRLAGGRLVECWQEWDEAGLREQLTAAR